MASDWTDVKIQELTILWNSKMSVAEIAVRMKKSQNSITSKAHSLKLDPRPNPIVVQGRRAVPRIPRAPAVTLAGVAPALVGEERFLSRSKCCYPLWGLGKPDHKYCDKPVVRGKSYCEECEKKTKVRHLQA